MPEATLLVVVRAAMARGYKPCTLSVLTTVVGLLSLLLVRIQPVRLFGVAASGALLFALGMIFLMMPDAMLLTRGRFWFLKNLTTGKSVDCGGKITLDKATRASGWGNFSIFR
jgi:predicted RND superfamily exporter protein